MLLVALNWMYVIAVIYLYGAALISLFRKVFSVHFEKPLHFTVVCITGMAVTTFLVTTLCLLMPVGLLAHGIVLIPAALFAVANKEKIRADWRYYRAEVSQANWLYKAVFWGFLVVLAGISSWPTSHYDEGLYYAQSMKWLQEYGTVPGLANLSHRIGFNSSWLILQSLFGMPFLGIRSFNDLNCLLYMLLFIYWLQGIIAVIKGERRLHTYLQALFLLPVLGIYFGASTDLMLYHENMFSSSSADVPASFISWLAFLLFLKKDDDAGLMQLNKILVVVLVCYLVTIKLSVMPILLLAVFCCWQLLRQRAFRGVTFLVTINAFLVIPWLIRNVILSGYLLFPFHKLDIIQVDWKMDPERVHGIEEVIRIWAMNPDFYNTKDETLLKFGTWLPDWFARQSFITELVLILVLIITVGGLLYIAYQLIRQGMAFGRKNILYIEFFITSLAGIAMWFLRAPDPRFGFGFTLFFCVFGLAAGLYCWAEKFARRAVIGVFLLAPILIVFNYNSVWSNKPLKKLIALPTYRFPGHVDTFSLAPGIQLYVAKDEDCWDSPLPCTIPLEYKDGIRLRGKTLRDGFLLGKDVSPQIPAAK